MKNVILDLLAVLQKCTETRGFIVKCKKQNRLRWGGVKKKREGGKP